MIVALAAGWVVWGHIIFELSDGPRKWKGNRTARVFFTIFWPSVILGKILFSVLKP